MSTDILQIDNFVYLTCEVVLELAVPPTTTARLDTRSVVQVRMVAMQIF